MMMCHLHHNHVKFLTNNKMLTITTVSNLISQQVMVTSTKLVFPSRALIRKTIYDKDTNNLKKRILALHGNEIETLLMNNNNTQKY